jgi:hypothetical protein
LEIVFSKSIYYDLTKQKDELQKILLSLNNLLNPSLTDLEVIEYYRYVKSTIENVTNIYNKANSIDETRDYLPKLRDFKKSAVYKTAASWTWDVNLSTRDVAILSNIQDASNYKLDRNVFLYNLNELNDDIKEKLSWCYYKIYEILTNLFVQTTPINMNTNFKNGTGIFTERGFIKFKAVSLPFCVEVLLTMGGAGLKDQLSGTVIDITKLMDHFLSLPTPVDDSPRPPLFNTLITDGIIVKEDNDYNISTNKATTASDTIKAIPLSGEVPISDSEIYEDKRDSQIQIDPTIDTHITEGFESTAKQTTLPLMTMILSKGGQNTGLIKRILSFTGSLARGVSTPMEEDEEPRRILKVKRSASQMGGAINPKLLDLIRSLPQLGEESTPPNQISDVFRDNSICFHPLLPIYMIIQSYMLSINNESIIDSLDANLFVNYFYFLRKITENVINIYYGANNNNEKKLEAYVIGICLRQLLFISNNDANYQYCLTALGTDDSVYSQVSSYTESLTHDISGKINFDPVTLQEGPIYLNSEFFSDFAHNIDVNRIFSNIPDYDSFDEEAFRNEVLAFSVEVAEQIMIDRGIRPATPINPIQGITPQQRLEAIQAQQARAELKKRGRDNDQEDDLAEGIQKRKPLYPFDPSRQKRGSDIFTYSDGDPSNMVYSTSSSSKRARTVGGKKKKTRRKNRKSYKNKTYKRMRKHRKTRRIKLKN